MQGVIAGTSSDGASIANAVEVVLRDAAQEPCRFCRSISSCAWWSFGAIAERKVGRGFAYSQPHSHIESPIEPPLAHYSSVATHHNWNRTCRLGGDLRFLRHADSPRAPFVA
mmetsp:Transcript_31175/g.66342  ORF Transcript_31175/g.66342 Transcript_31175/m.66342 type:complete len:112 (-) Transcript_31175:1200-1535(-)